MEIKVKKVNKMEVKIYNLSVFKGDNFKMPETNGLL